MTKEMESLYADLFEAAGLGRRIGEKIAATEGQTQARWQTMWIIATDDALTVPQIARRLGVSRQNEQRVVNDLIDGGLAELVPNPDHRTSPLIRLTHEGNRALEGINQAATQSNDAIEADLTPTKVTQLRKLLRDFTTSARTQHPET
jgi:DNA-binding MarR family transcriptional regulator